MTEKIYLEACPGCGSTPDIDDPDFLYPSTPCRTLWRAHCCRNGCGCGWSVLSDSAEGAVKAWNRRIANVKPLTEDAYEQWIQHLSQALAQLKAAAEMFQDPGFEKIMNPGMQAALLQGEIARADAVLQELHEMQENRFKQ